MTTHELRVEILGADEAILAAGTVNVPKYEAVPVALRLPGNFLNRRTRDVVVVDGSTWIETFIPVDGPADEASADDEAEAQELLGALLASVQNNIVVGDRTFVPVGTPHLEVRRHGPRLVASIQVGSPMYGALAVFGVDQLEPVEVWMLGLTEALGGEEKMLPPKVDLDDAELVDGDLLTGLFTVRAEDVELVADRVRYRDAAKRLDIAIYQGNAAGEAEAFSEVSELRARLVAAGVSLVSGVAPR